VIVATPQHWRHIRTGLVCHEFDVDQLIDRGRIMVADAQEMLDRLFIGDRLDAVRFRTVIGGMLHQAAARGGSVRAYGEMVDLLARAGRVADAIVLEGLWCALGETQAFSLLCGYRPGSLSDPGDREVIRSLHYRELSNAP
jgi:hypothetical protein